VHRGPTIKVQLRFHRAIAAVIKERSWHPSQQFRDRTDGSVVMTLDVLDETREQYASGGGARLTDREGQPLLPFLFPRLASA
jgi:hypothetical protein